MVGRQTARGIVPPRLGQIFRDRNDLPVAPDLRTQLTQELTHSANLIVVCSPSAARSSWVNQEILAYQRLHGDARVFALIVDGEPFASLNHFAELECLPEALRFQANPDGSRSDRPAEPLACDLRHAADGKRMALLKLIAGILGLGLDELARRDHQRRLGLQRLISAAALVAVGVLSALSYLAISARDLAEQRRLAAEDLINFMLTDLRERLEPIGRLDVLDVVDEKVLAFYASQDHRQLSAEALSRQSGAMHLLGEMRDLAGDSDAAGRLFAQAAGITAELLRRDPTNSQRIYDHAQSSFWAGYPAYQAGDYAQAQHWFDQYLALARHLNSLEPHKPEWQLELYYALANQAVLLFERGQYNEAYQLFQEAEPLLRAHGIQGSEVRQSLINNYSWLASAALGKADFGAAIKHRRAALAEISHWLTEEPLRQDIQDLAVTAHNALSDLYGLTGQRRAQLNHLQRGLTLAKQLVDNDPINTEKRYTQLASELRLLRWQAERGELTPANARQWIADAQHLSDNASGNFNYRKQWLTGFALLGLQLLALDRGTTLSEALRTIDQQQTFFNAPSARQLQKLLFLAHLGAHELALQQIASGDPERLAEAIALAKRNGNFFDYSLVCEVLQAHQLSGADLEQIRQKIATLDIHASCIPTHAQGVAP